MPEYFEAPPSAEYKNALKAIEPEIREAQFETLRAQHGEPDKAVTAGQLAKLMGYDHFRPLNSVYGRLGHLLAKELGKQPKKQTDDFKRWWSVLSTGQSTPEGFVWKMRPQVADALEQLGWVDAEERTLPEEVAETEDDSLREGAVREVRVNAYERSSSARRRCIEHYGYQCYVCGFDFEERYGEVGKELIHVHHENPLAKGEQERGVHPTEDLKPVCPNCHEIIHQGDHQDDPPYSVEEVRDMLRQ